MKLPGKSKESLEFVKVHIRILTFIVKRGNIFLLLTCDCLKSLLGFKYFKGVL